MLAYTGYLNKLMDTEKEINTSQHVKRIMQLLIIPITSTFTVFTQRHEGKTAPGSFWLEFSFCCTHCLHMRLLHTCLLMCKPIYSCLHLHRFQCASAAMCSVHIWNDDRWWEGSRSFETCHSVPVYEPMTGDTHPSTSKFITVHHLPTCGVMTFSQSYKNPRKPVGINQCLSTFPAAAHIHY